MISISYEVLKERLPELSEMAQQLARKILNMMERSVILAKRGILLEPGRMLYLEGYEEALKDFSIFLPAGMEKSRISLLRVDGTDLDMYLSDNHQTMPEDQVSMGVGTKCPIVFFRNDDEHKGENGYD